MQFMSVWLSDLADEWRVVFIHRSIHIHFVSVTCSVVSPSRKCVLKCVVKRELIGGLPGYTVMTLLVRYRCESHEITRHKKKIGVSNH